MLTFGANIAYSRAQTDKTLTSAGLFASAGSGTMTSVYRWSAFDDMTHYPNVEGRRHRLPDVSDALGFWDERDNPYWIPNKNKLKDKTERPTGSEIGRA